MSGTERHICLLRQLGVLRMARRPKFMRTEAERAVRNEESYHCDWSYESIAKGIGLGLWLSTNPSFKSKSNSEDDIGVQESHEGDHDPLETINFSFVTTCPLNMQVLGVDRRNKTTMEDLNSSSRIIWTWITFVVGFFLSILLSNENLAMASGGRYNTSSVPVSGKLNVHLVPHTHDDLGWIVTPDQYYVGLESDSVYSGQITKAVQYIVHTVVQELEEDPDRRFSYAEMGFFMRWWREQGNAKQQLVRRLVATGQLEFVNGGWCMHDEAATHYVDMIDQTTLGHRYLKDLFGIAPRQGWQIDPFGHSAVQAYLLGAEAGFDSIFTARIDYQDRSVRIANKTLEMIWQGSDSLKATSQVFMGVFKVHYSPPETFEFETDNQNYTPVQDDPNLREYNVDQRVDDLVREAQRIAAATRTNHVMFTMGDDFTYASASTWFSPMDKLIHYANLDGRVNVLYSTPSIYLDAKHSANETWPLKTGDFFPYADGASSYWTGYFTSRPALKAYVRFLSGYLQAARQLEFFRGRRETDTFSTDTLEEAMATVQHHDGISGTSKQAVADDYAQSLYIGAEQSKRTINAALSDLSGNTNAEFEQCGLLNITFCPASEAATKSNGTTANESLVVVAYNSLAWPRIEYVRIPVSGENLIVTDSKGQAVVSQIVPTSNATKNVREFYAQANLGVQVPEGEVFDLVFKASLPALGFTSFTIGHSVPGQVGAAVKSTTEVLSTSSTSSKIGNGEGFDLTFSSTTGELSSLSHKNTSVNLNVTQTNLYYESGSNGAQSSGAYIFLPANDTAQSVVSSGDRVSSTIIRGPLVEETWQVFSPWVSQVTRVYKEQDHAEVEFTIGDIPTGDSGKEVITRFNTDIRSNKTFYTDSNGRDFLKRVRDHRDSWPLTVEQPVAGNYYPINLGIYISDGETDFSVLVDRAVGGASLVDGQMELMLHRRLTQDDGRGVGEALNEEVCLSDTAACQGLTTRGRYFLSAKTKDDAAQWRRRQGQAFLAPLLLAFTTTSSNASTGRFSNPEFSAIVSNASLPENVALITLQELEVGKTVLLRLAHLYQTGEHSELSKLATVNLKDVLPGVQITNATEMSLTANQARSDMKTLGWNLDDSGEPSDQAFQPVIRGASFNPSSLAVELGPMEIRTFVISFQLRSSQGGQ